MHSVVGCRPWTERAAENQQSWPGSAHLVGYKVPTPLSCLGYRGLTFILATLAVLNEELNM